MFILNTRGEMINISEFENIRLEYKTFLGNKAHCIVGIRSFHRDQPWRSVETNIAFFGFRKLAEMAYEDLMKAISEGTETFNMPDSAKLLEDADAETIIELQEYEEEWLREKNPKPKSLGCFSVIVILFTFAVSIFLTIFH